MGLQQVNHWRRLAIAVALLVGVLAIGTIGYLVLGFGLVDALYQTVTTVATVGFREVRPFDTAGKIFTMVLIMLGVGAVLSVPLGVGISALELIVILVQAYVFTLLTAVFIGMAIHVHH